MKRIILIIGVLVMLLSGFLPYTTATDSYKKALEASPNVVYFEPLGMKNKDAIDVSLYEYGRVYYSISTNGDDYSNSQQQVATFCFGMLAILAVITILELIFAITQKPKTTIVFNILSVIMFWVIRTDFQSRNVIQIDKLNWGIATYVYLIGFIFVIVGAVILLRDKHKA